MSTIRQLASIPFAATLGWLLLLTGLVSSACSSTGQRADPAYRVGIQNSEWPPDTGPRVAVDAAHHNFHTIDGRYQAFAQLLRQDGFRVKSFDSLFSAESLVDLDVIGYFQCSGCRKFYR